MLESKSRFGVCSYSPGFDVIHKIICLLNGQETSDLYFCLKSHHLSYLLAYISQ